MTQYELQLSCTTTHVPCMTFNTVTMHPLSYMGLPWIEPPANCASIIEVNYMLRIAEAVRRTACTICNKQSFFLFCVSSKREKTVNSHAYRSVNKTFTQSQWHLTELFHDFHQFSTALMPLSSNLSILHVEHVDLLLMSLKTNKQKSNKKRNYFVIICVV